MSGFRKWSEAQEQKRIGEALGATGHGGDGAPPATDLEQEFGIVDQTVHRPWLVPGAGKLLAGFDRVRSRQR